MRVQWSLFKLMKRRKENEEKNNRKEKGGLRKKRRLGIAWGAVGHRKACVQ